MLSMLSLCWSSRFYLLSTSPIRFIWQTLYAKSIYCKGMNAVLFGSLLSSLGCSQQHNNSLFTSSLTCFKTIIPNMWPFAFMELTAGVISVKKRQSRPLRPHYASSEVLVGCCWKSVNHTHFLRWLARCVEVWQFDLSQALCLHRSHYFVTAQRGGTVGKCVLLKPHPSSLYDSRHWRQV